MPFPRLTSPLVLAPMAGLTDTAFRRLVKRHGGCGLVVTEMVSCEGVIRGIDRTLEYAEFVDAERPVAVQLVGGDPARMAAAARILEARGADIVDINMGCPVRKIASNSAGCSLMKDPRRAAAIVRETVRAVSVPVTVKMRAGWDAAHCNAVDLARTAEDAGAAAIAVHGRTAEQGYSGRADWNLINDVAESVRIPVFGSGDLMDPAGIVERLRGSRLAGALVGRGVLRNPWLMAQASDLLTGLPVREVTREDRGRFLLDYIELLAGRHVRGHEAPERTPSPRQARTPEDAERRRPGSERFVINKIRALSSWITRGVDGGAHLRVAINHAESVTELRGLVSGFYGLEVAV